MSQCGSINVCACPLCARMHVCVVLIFIFIFLVEYIKRIWKLYSPLPRKKLIVLCHQFCEVIVVDAVPYARAAFYKSYTIVGVADGQGRKQLWICALFLIYFTGLASWRWRVVARGFRVKTNNELEVSCFCRRSCCLWSFHYREQRREGEANGYRES